MSELLHHSPALIVRQLLVDLNLAINPNGSKTDWQAWANKEVDLPDNILTVKNTTGLDQGYSQLSGEYYEHFGVQIVVRAINDEVGGYKARTLLNGLVTMDSPRNVTIEGHTYCVQCFNKSGSIIYAGYDSATSKRQLFTVNGLVPINELN